MEVRGRDLGTGLPRTVTVTSLDGFNALKEPVAMVIAAVKRVLEQTPPELAADLIGHGIVMTGGGSLLDGLAQAVSRETSLEVRVADNAISCVALGTGKVLASVEVLTTVQSRSSRRIF
jgi:rod shape-determining protein MreB